MICHMFAEADGFFVAEYQEQDVTMPIDSCRNELLDKHQYNRQRADAQPSA